LKKEEEVQAKGICNIFNKIIAVDFPNLKKELSILLRNPPGYQTGLTKIELLYGILSLKQLAKRTEKERNNIKR
jgi:hypothetical protein